MLRRWAHNFMDRLLEPSAVEVQRVLNGMLEGVLNLANWLVVIAAIRYAATKTHHNQLVILSRVLAFIWMLYLVTNVVDRFFSALLRPSGLRTKWVWGVTSAFLSGVCGQLVYNWVTRVVEALASATQ